MIRRTFCDRLGIAAVAEVFEATDTFWEDYAPDLISYGMPAKLDFYG